MISKRTVAVWGDTTASIAFATVGALSVLGMALTWKYQGSPWLPIALLPGYFPHAYKVLEWSAFYFVVIRPRFRLRAFPAFLAMYGFLEVWFNSVYLLTHPAGFSLGVYPYLDSQYPLRLGAYFLAFGVGLVLAKPQLRIPSGQGVANLAKLVFLLYLVYNQIGAINAGYGTVTNGAWTPGAVLNDLIGDTVYLGALWALVYPARLKSGSPTPLTPKNSAQTPRASFGAE